MRQEAPLAADGAGGDRRSVANHVTVEHCVATEDSMAEGHVENGKQEPVDVTPRPAQVKVKLKIFTNKLY